jgi:hypothetical protein
MAVTMTRVPAAHGSVVLGIMPLATTATANRSKPRRFLMPLLWWRRW